MSSWAQAPLLVFSTPSGARHYHDALLPLAQWRGPRAVLGFEAQAACLIASLPAAARKRVVFAPCPEIFAHPAALAQSFASLGAAHRELLPALRQAAQAAGGDGQRVLHRATQLRQAQLRLTHLRLGGLRQARLLKGARNIVVEAGREGRRIVAVTRHPFVDGLTVPEGVAAVALFSPGGRARGEGGDGDGSAWALRHVSGRAAVIEALAPALLAADLRGPADRQADGQASLFARGGVLAMKLAAHDPALFRDPDARLRPALPPELAAGEGRVVVVAWNLADPVSAAPFLLKQLHEILPGGARLVLMPFNDLGPEGRIRALLREITAAGVQPRLLEETWLLRAEGRAGLRALAKTGAVVWLDGGDPECAASAARLRAARIVSVAAAPPPGLPPAWQSQITLPAGEQRWIVGESAFGTLTADCALPLFGGLAAGVQASLGAQVARRAGGAALAAFAEDGGDDASDDDREAGQ